MKRIYTKITNPALNVVNVETGEIVSGVAEIKCSDLDEFIMLFLNSIGKISNLDGNSIRVLMCCWKLSTFNLNVPEANIINNNAAFKEDVRKLGCSLTDSVINKAFHVLTKEQLLIKRCKGVYFLNPDYFFKGTLSNRAKLKYEISYNAI